MIDTVLLRPLPFKNPEQLVMIWARVAHEESEKDVASYPDYVDYRDQNHSLTSLAAFTRASAILNGVGESKPLDGLAVSPAIFDVLGGWPMLGRGFTREEDKVGAAPVAVLSYNCWKSAFGGDRAIVGQQINFSGRSTTVLGVMPAGWKFPVEDDKIDYLSPLEPLIPKEVHHRGGHSFSLVGRLRDGVRPEIPAAFASFSTPKQACSKPVTELGN